MLFVCHPNILHMHCFQFSLCAILTPKRNWRQCLCKILGWQTKSIMVCYGIFWSGQYRTWGIVMYAKLGNKNVETLYSNRVTTENEGIHTPPPLLHSKMECLLFYIESSNNGTKLHAGDGGGKAFIYPLEVSKTSESPLIGRSVSTNFKT